MRSATESLIATRQTERALEAGNSAPTLRLQDQRGIEVASDTLLRHGRLFLTFYTDSSCPACSRDTANSKALGCHRHPGLPTCRSSALSQSARTSALLRHWKRPRPQPGTSATERRRDD